MDTAEPAVTAAPDEDAHDPPRRRVNEWYTRLLDGKATAPPPPAPRGAWTVLAVIALALLVGLIVVVGLRTSLGALRDAALAAHIETQAASLYWIGVDGLIVVAIIAALVLRHDPRARRYCLFIIGLFTLASGLLQYLHGLGWFTPDPVTHLMPRLPWGVVLVIAVLVIGTIFCGTHLFVHALRRLFPGTRLDAHPAHSPSGDRSGAESGTNHGSGDSDTHGEKGVSLSADEEREERKRWAAITVRLLVDNDITPPRKRLAAEYGISPRQVGYVIADVNQEREEQAEREAAARETDRVVEPFRVPVELPSPNGSGPRPEPVTTTS